MAVGLFWFDIRSRFIWLGLQMPRRHEYKFVLFQSIQFFIHGPWCQYTVFVQILPHLFNNNKVLFVFQWCFGSALFHLDTTSECTHPYFDLDTTSGCTHQYFECFDILVKIAFDKWWQHYAHYEGSIVVELGLYCSHMSRYHKWIHSPIFWMLYHSCKDCISYMMAPLFIAWRLMQSAIACFQ